jgi:hypothetical protein
MNHPAMLAMRIYSSWTERIFSVDGLENGLGLGIFIAAMLVPLMARRRSPVSHYFSGPFALALCPFLFAAVIALLRIHLLIEYEDWTPSYVVERLRYPFQILLCGGALSIFSIANYTAIHKARRSTAP